MSPSPSALQQQIATVCGVSLKGLSKQSAAALLRFALAEELLGIVPEHPTTESQREIARQLALPHLSDFKELAALQIRASFVRLNEEAMKEHKFSSGMRVVFIGGPHVRELSYAVGEVLVISTVKPDGRVYFKASNGSTAYASQLKPFA